MAVRARIGSLPDKDAQRDERFREASDTYGPALLRLARAYESDAERRRDLVQEIHLELWQSLAKFDGRCSMRTWVYRVAHNVASSHIRRELRWSASRLKRLDEITEVSASGDLELSIGKRHALDRLRALIRELKPLDCQVMLLYLEDFDATSIAEVTGLSVGNVATRVHRIKRTLACRFGEEKRRE